MALAQFNGLVVLQFDDETSGNFQSAAPITVRDAITNNLVTIFSDEVSTPLSNPFNTGSQGQFTFWVESGNYNLISNESTPDEEQILNVPIIFVPGAAPIQTVFGRVGDIVAVANDYDALKVEYDPTVLPNPISNALNVQSAIDENSNAISFLSGAVVLRGAWDALANLPDLVAETKVSGNYWLVDEGGPTVLPLYPGQTPHLMPWVYLDRVLWLDDGLGSTGFVQLRPDTADFLPLIGGTMFGDIIASNALSMNNILSISDIGSIGRPESYNKAFVDIFNGFGTFLLADTGFSPSLSGLMCRGSGGRGFALYGNSKLNQALIFSGFNNSGVPDAESSNVFMSTSKTSTEAESLLDNAVQNTGDETINGVKTFIENPVGAVQGTSETRLTRKDYVDGLDSQNIKLASGRDSAQSNVILDNAEASNWGKTIIASQNVDLDTMLTSGIFTVTSLSGIPLSSRAVLTVKSVSTGEIVQELLQSQGNGNSSNNSWFRHLYNSIWEPWKEISTVDYVINQVPKAGGELAVVVGADRTVTLATPYPDNNYSISLQIVNFTGDTALPTAVSITASSFVIKNNSGSGSNDILWTTAAFNNS